MRRSSVRTKRWKTPASSTHGSKAAALTCGPSGASISRILRRDSFDDGLNPNAWSACSTLPGARCHRIAHSIGVLLEYRARLSGEFQVREDQAGVESQGEDRARANSLQGNVIGIVPLAGEHNFVVERDRTVGQKELRSSLSRTYDFPDAFRPHR